MHLLKTVRKASQDKKGFTLVEMIVVIVILAILAAIFVPSLMQYIDRAKNQQIIINARSVYLAVQTLASEEYAELSPTQNNVTADEALALADVTGGEIRFTLSEAYQISSFYYKDTASGKVTSYDGTSWSVPDTSASLPMY